MKHVTSLSLVVLLSITGCTTTDPERSPGRVHYYDRNGDGKVDLETHHYPGWADADWQLRDDNYDGRYEKKIVCGFAVKEFTVDIPVPINVKITRTP